MRYRFMRFPGGRAKAVTFSYDDGRNFDIPLAEIFDRYGVKGTFNINSSRIDQEPGGKRLTAQEIREHLLGAGHEVAVHGKIHRAPGLSRPMDVIQEFLDCRMELEQLFGIIIRGCAYPDSGIKRVQSGTDAEHTAQILKDLDIVYARTANDNTHDFSLPTNWYNWKSTVHHDDPDVFELVEKFLGLELENEYIARRWPKLFYVWGHSYEFDRNKNWDRIEKICQTLGGREDLWYATNIEIYEYVHAFESLIFSADGSRVYNPTLLTVWFYQDGTVYQVGSGETLEII